MTDFVTIDGLQELTQMLTDLPPKLQKQAIKPALREVGKLVRNEAKRNLQRHRRTGLLISQVSMVSLRDKPGFPVAVIVGVPKKSKIMEVLAEKRKGMKPGWKPFYWRYLEYGFTRKGKHYPAQPWLRPAIETAKTQAPAILNKYMGVFHREAMQNSLRRTS